MQDPLVVRWTRARATARVPTRMSADAAGFDLCACLPHGQTLTLAPGGGRAAVPTGLRLELPRGSEAQVRPRSGLARRHGVTVLNAPGTIDSDYRGEIEVLLINHGTDAFVIQDGDRVAQLVFARVIDVRFDAVDALGASARGEQGFGSTGVASAPAGLVE